MKVKKNSLLMIACIVWSFAGYNVLRIGICEYYEHIEQQALLNVLMSAAVFAVFFKFVFGRLVKKHTARIAGYSEEKHFFLKFFDKKSFIIMACMISGGIVLRQSGLAPSRFIAVFYTGLGGALLMAGVMFGVNFLQSQRKISAEQ